MGRILNLIKARFCGPNHAKEVHLGEGHKTPDMDLRAQTLISLVSLVVISSRSAQTKGRLEIFTRTIDLV